MRRLCTELSSLGRTMQPRTIPRKIPLGFFAMDILYSSPETPTENRFVDVTRYPYSKLTGGIPTKTYTAQQFTTMFMDIGVLLYRFPEFLLIDNRAQFGGNVFN